MRNCWFLIVYRFEGCVDYDHEDFMQPVFVKRNEDLKTHVLRLLQGCKCPEQNCSWKGYELKSIYKLSPSGVKTEIDISKFKVK